MNQQNCGHCHTCGNALRNVLDGEEWCDTCKQYRRYKSHGWGANGDGPEYQCPPTHEQIVQSTIEARRNGPIPWRKYGK